MFQGCNLLVCELALCFNNSADRSHIALGKGSGLARCQERPPRALMKTQSE